MYGIRGRFSNVQKCIRSWFSPAKFIPGKMRSTIAGSIFCLMTAEVLLFLRLQVAIKHGHLPWYITDVVIMAVSGVEALTAPFSSWFGYKRRRTLILAAASLPATMIFLLYALPAVNRSVFLSAGMTTPAILQLTIVVFISLSVAFARNAMLAHGVGYLAEHSLEGTTLTIAVFILCRVLGLQLFSRITKNTMPIWLQVVGITGPLVFNIVKLIRFPSMPPIADGVTRVQSDGRGFFSSLCRVASNKLVMSQMCAAAFLGAALWGFGYHQNDVAKAKYFAITTAHIKDELADIVRLLTVFAAVIFFGWWYGAPIMPVFRRAAAAKLATILTAVAIIMYPTIAVALGCDVGQVAGLTGNSYTQPECSSQCGSTSALLPICLVDQMTSYVSPCHAGCYNNETVGGVTFLSNCTCGVGRAIPGICSQSSCRDSHELYKLLFIVTMLCSIVAMQKQMTLMVHASDPRDRSVVIGVACTVVAIVVFILGHGIFFLIRALTCSWSEDGVCRLQNSAFPYIIGGTSGGFALLSFSISFFTWLKLRRRKDTIDQAVVYEINGHNVQSRL